MISRIYHPYHTWEDYQNGMYEIQAQIKGNHNNLLNIAQNLLKNPQELYLAMQYVAFKWTHSAETNLSNTNRNRQAWLGQAACCYIGRVPEEITKRAWRNLTDMERKTANKVADMIIQKWKNEYVNKGIKQTNLEVFSNAKT